MRIYKNQLDKENKLLNEFERHFWVKSEKGKEEMFIELIKVGN
jgi:hypothetical protein